MIPAAPTNFSLAFNFSDWMQRYLNKEHDYLCTRFLEIISHFRDVQLSSVEPRTQYFIDQFCKCFLAIFTEVDFPVSNAHAYGFISSNHVLMNMVAISHFKTTDSHLAIVLLQPNNFTKVLTLLNARCFTKVDRKVLFDTHPAAASVWYAHYACAYYGALQDKLGYENLREHFRFQHASLVIKDQAQEAFFGSTYAGDDLDQLVKPVVNRCARKVWRDLPPIQNFPNPKKIAVISGLWEPTSSVHRIYSEMLRALKSKYHLTLVALGNTQQSDLSMFDEVRVVSSSNGILDVNAIATNDFQIVIFPDIGMFGTSIPLANLRIAPIQIAWLGHPVSTFGAEIDYFISGASVEIPDGPERNYAERLVLLPGLGVVNNVPRYQVLGAKKDDSVFTINGLFWAQKINHPFVKTLQKLLARVTRKVKIRIFPGVSLSRANDRIPFVRDIEDALGAHHVEVSEALDYRTYMRQIEHGDFTLDSFPFGGCNTVSDSLFARVPIVTWESDKWYGRIGSQMLRLIGLDECVATTEAQFLDIAVRLIDDPAFLARIRERVKSADLASIIYCPDEAHHMLEAVDYLVANHTQLASETSREPIRIGRDFGGTRQEGRQ